MGLLQRIFRVFAWSTSMLIIAWLLVIGLDLVWFRSTIPITFRDARWSGVCKTHQYMGLTGRLLVRLPTPLPEEGEFKAEALVYYPIYSIWKTGSFVPMDFAGRFSASGALSAGETTNQIPGASNPDGVKGKSGTLYFKGTAGNQVVEYSALVNKNQTRIVGGYLSTGPSDYGIFTIERW